MAKQPFEILGIAPTTDGRAIRAAFLRLARIYHPDRYLDSPDDVRAEAERRMKEATIAYESLREQRPEERAPAIKIDDKVLQERARKYRQAIEAKQAKDEVDRAKWQRWEEVERRARASANLEADIASRIASEVNGVHVPPKGDQAPAADPAPIQKSARTAQDKLAERLDAARRGESAPLVPQQANYN